MNSYGFVYFLIVSHASADSSICSLNRDKKSNNEFEIYVVSLVSVVSVVSIVSVVSVVAHSHEVTGSISVCSSKSFLFVL